MKSEDKKTNQYKPGFLETWGRKVLISLAQKHQSTREKQNIESKDKLPFQIGSQNLLRTGVFWSFWIGFLPSVFFVLGLGYGPGFDLGNLTISSILWFGFLLTFWTFIEFYLLFKLGFLLAYRMAELAEIELANEPELYTPLPSMLARIVLEIPDPRILLYGIDPYKHLDKRAAFFSTLLYKSKVFLSNISAKFLLKAFIGRSGLRYWVEFISGPITGIWDSVTTYIILKELQKRIITRKIANLLLGELNSKIFSDIGFNQIIRTVAIAIVFTKTFHPNFEYLLLRLVGQLESRDHLENLDDWEIWTFQFQKLTDLENDKNLKLFAILSAFDGKINTEEETSFMDIQKFSNANYFEFSKTLCSKINSGKLSESVDLVREFWT